MKEKVTPDYPPKVPDNEKEFNEAVCLLGNHAKLKGKLTPKTQQRLVELIGVYPTEQQAFHWKKRLKALGAADDNRKSQQQEQEVRQKIAQ